ncbi:FAD/NAD(P)-binding domain-containing protein [Daedaleopsis nitida]|nr:FAD/NAD(P)-binding domain-containing protein [Daedaleopsis nitida]
MSRLRVAIVGAGPSGLLLGLALRKFAPDVDFELYEGASQLSEVGAGLNVWLRMWYILQAIGIDSALLPMAGGGGAHTTHANYRKSDQPEGWETSYTFYRPDLQKVLLEQLQTTHTIHLRKRVEAYVQPEDSTRPIELQFQDGTTATCDVLIGADGVRSVVRGVMYSGLANAALAAGKTEEADRLRSCVPAVFSGFITYRMLVHKTSLSEEDAKSPALNGEDMVLYCGKNRHLITYPVAQGRILNVAAVVSNLDLEGTVYEGPWVSSVSKDEVEGCYSGWEPAVQEVVKHMQEPAQKWVINVCKKLPTYVHGRVALMGDAAHAMCPTQGAGAGQCFEDVYCLAQLLGRPDVTKENVSLALKVYDETRRPFSQNVASLSYLSGRTMHLNSSQYTDLTEEESASGTIFTKDHLRELIAAVKEQASWRQETTVADDMRVTFRKLDEALSDK